MLNWIFSSALVLLVILLRAVLKNRLDPRLRYALWLLLFSAAPLDESLCRQLLALAG